MADFSNIKQEVKSVIHDNQLGEITSEKLRDLELDIIDSIDTEKQDVISDLSEIRQNSSNAYQKPQSGIPSTDLANQVQTSLGKADTALQPEDVAEIESVIPAEADKDNKLADKNYVDTNISTASATFRGTSAADLTEQQFLAWANALTKDKNDYVFWNTVDSDGDEIFKRYKWDGTQWSYEFTLSNTDKAILYKEQNLTDAQRLQALANVSNQTANSTTGKIGYKVLDPTKTFAEQVTAENTIYEIRDVFDLNNGSVTTPTGCTLKFNGGKITNGTVVSNDTIIEGTPDIESVSGEFYNSDFTEKIKIGSNYKLPNKTFVVTQDEFDAIVAKINNKESVDVVLSGREFVLKTPINIREETNEINISITGCEGTVIKGNNDIYKKSDADSTYVSLTHYRCRVKHGINPFSIVVNESGDIVEFNNKKSIQLNGKFLNTDGSDISTQGGQIDSILIPYFECGYENGDILFGYIESAYNKCKFLITGTTTINSESYYVASIESYSIDGSVRLIEGNINYLYSNYGVNVVSVFNLKGSGVYFDGDYIYIPCSIDSIELVNLLNTTQAYNLGSIKITINNGSISFNGISFYNFDTCLNLNIPTNGTKSRNITIENCTFKNIIGQCLEIKNYNTTRSTNSITNNKFIDVCIGYGYNRINSDYLGSGYVPAFLFNGNVIHRKKGYYGNNTVFQVNADASITDCVIHNNTFNDFIVRNGWITIDSCKFYCDDEFISDNNNLGRDCGLLYIGQLTADNWETNGLHKCRVSNCKIYNGYAYFGTCHGIYCDNGRTDVLIENNVVFNIQSNAITARKHNETYASKNVVIQNNVIEGSITANGASALTGNEIPLVDNNILLGKYDNTIDARNTGTNKLLGDYNIINDNVFINRNDRDLIPVGTLNLVKFTSISKPIGKKEIKISYMSNDPTNYHLIRFKNNTIGFNNYFKVSFVSEYKALYYEIVLDNNIYSVSQNDSLYFANLYANSNGTYNYCKAYKWVEDDFINLAVCAMEMARPGLGMQGGVFTVESTQNCIDSLQITCNNLKSNFPSNISSKTGFMSRVYVPRDITIVLPSSGNGKIFPTSLEEPFVINYNNQYVNIPVIVNNTSNYSTNLGVITMYGVYQTRGATTLRPTPSAYDLGLQYYDTDLNKYICWNGTDWVNLDGTPLS